MRLQALGVERNADQAAIKKAYRRMALRYHPDKTGNDPELVERFQLIQKAYETLGDERKRAVYDTYGERGAAMFESMSGLATFLDPEIIKAVNAVFFAGTLLVAALILFPSFLSLRADGKVSWSWVAVFSPLFIVDVALFAVLMRARAPKRGDPHEGMEPSEEDEADPAAADAADAANQRMAKVIGSVYLIALTVQQILIALKLDDSISASWAVVFVPWYILELLHVGLGVMQTGSELAYNAALAVARERHVEGEPEIAETPKQPFLIVYDNFYVVVLRIAQLALIVSKIDGSAASLSWVVVFVPSWLWGLLKIGSVALWALAEKKAARESDSEARSAEFKSTLTLRIIGLTVYLGLFYLGVGLLVSRLSNGDSATPSTAVILIPVFIVLSLLFCIVACCLPLMFAATRYQLRQQMGDDGSADPEAQNSAAQPTSVVSVHKRIGGPADGNAGENGAPGSSTGAESSDTIHADP
ncbi:hypothetical protein HK105_202399 [Polyrhizophydium stewartii]|uniref:J domain-containing protein n=1 Tax=Polyrhizophydium stewartii TaxID=2732419 RepID=A0ABR4NEQ4_9FUNG|nr:hypothetical protein HK105_001722 [Polyrhizophydium stewartii]